jgi:hypothetical protein
MASALVGCAWLVLGALAAVRECHVEDLEVEETAEFTPHASLVNERAVVQRKIETNQRDLEMESKKMADIARRNVGYREVVYSHDTSGLRIVEQNIDELRCDVVGCASY